MNNPVDAALARQWSQASVTRKQVYHWAWFMPAFQSYAESALARAGLSGEVNDTLAGRAFLEWVCIAEQCASYARVQPVDHAHYLCGRLLRCLLQARPVLLHDSASGPQAPAASWPEGHMLLGFVCTLLEAYRLELSAGPLQWQASVLDRHWLSFRENVAEDADLAGPFLDLFLGLEPVWEFPISPTNRPAALRSAP
jgi:hypothetical protein